MPAGGSRGWRMVAPDSLWVHVRIQEAKHLRDLTRLEGPVDQPNRLDVLLRHHLPRRPAASRGLQQSGGDMNNGKEKESGGSPSRGALAVGRLAGECATRPEPVRDADRRRGCHRWCIGAGRRSRDVTEAVQAEGEEAHRERARERPLRANADGGHSDHVGAHQRYPRFTCCCERPSRRTSSGIGTQSGIRAAIRREVSRIVNSSSRSWQTQPPQTGRG